jgi:hypothetical protein
VLSERVLPGISWLISKFINAKNHLKPETRADSSALKHSGFYTVSFSLKFANRLQNARQSLGAAGLFTVVISCR